MTINCICVDDEPLALSQITRYIEKVPYLNLVASCHDAFEAIEVIDKNEIDLIYVDINMPDLNGLDFVRSLTNKPLVVFTTAYSEYAIEGIKVEALDYLLKPFSFNDLFQSAEKARTRLESTQQAPKPSADTALFVRSDSRTVRLDYEKIIYIEGMNEYVRIYVEGMDKPLMPLLSMRKLEETLPADQFMRVHRSYLINLTKIDEVQKQRISIGKKLIPIGESYKDKFQAYMDSHTMR